MLLMTGPLVAKGHVRVWEKRKVKLSFVKTVSGESDVPRCEICEHSQKKNQPSLILAQKRQAEFRKFQNSLN